MKAWIKIIFFTVFIYSNSYSQKSGGESGYLLHPIDTKKCTSYYNSFFIGECNTTKLLSYLTTHFEHLKFPKVSLYLSDSIKSKTGIHFTFTEMYNNIPVYRGQIKVNCNDKGYITSIFDNTFSFIGEPSSDFPSPAIAGQLLSNKINTEIIQQQHCYFPFNEDLLPALRIELQENSNYNYEIILDTYSNILYQRNLNNYYSAQAATDSTVSALVFNPDPLTTANVVYGAPYIDNNDNDVAVLNAERVLKNIRVQYSGDTFYLKNNFVQIKDFDTPVIPPAYMKTSPLFSFTRAQSGFEDVNAFYHITEFQTHIQSLGFTNLVNYSIEVDAHAMGGSDNSQFTPSTRRLYFGEGNVDDAEDADVIIHEYGHAISHSAAPGTNNGTQRQALDEANGDYLASSYSRFLNSYKWENVFSWDGHNPFWPGRTSVSSKNYPINLMGDIYEDAEIWSSTLMQIWGDIGRNITDEILFESLYNYSSNMSMADAAALYIQADSNLYNGQHYTSICNRFLNRGLVSACNVSLNELYKESPFTINTLAFSEGKNLEIIFSNPATGIIKIYDAQSKLIRSENISNALSAEITGYFAKGIYVISLQTEKETYVAKAIRY